MASCSDPKWKVVIQMESWRWFHIRLYSEMSTEESDSNKMGRQVNACVFHEEGRRGEKKKTTLWWAFLVSFASHVIILLKPNPKVKSWNKKHPGGELITRVRPVGLWVLPVLFFSLFPLIQSVRKSSNLHLQAAPRVSLVLIPFMVVLLVQTSSFLTWIIRDSLLSFCFYVNLIVSLLWSESSNAPFPRIKAQALTVACNILTVMLLIF